MSAKDRWGNELYLLPYIKTGECTECKQPRVGNQADWTVCPLCIESKKIEKWRQQYEEERERIRAKMFEPGWKYVHEPDPNDKHQ